MISKIVVRPYKKAPDQLPLHPPWRRYLASVGLVAVRNFSIALLFSVFGRFMPRERQGGAEATALADAVQARFRAVGAKAKAQPAGALKIRHLPLTAP